jgi:hypothetical protein
MRFDDLIFTCDDGSPSVSVSLNLQVDGSYTFDPMPADVSGIQGGRLEVGGDMNPGGNVSLGYWAPGSGDNPTTTGAFVGENGDVLSGVFTSPVVTVPTNTPVSLELSLMVRLGNCCVPDVRVNGRGTVQFAYEAVGPVFNFHGVPDGVECTVNSSEANIADNIWNPEPVRTESQTWGQIKALYR